MQKFAGIIIVGLVSLLLSGCSAVYHDQLKLGMPATLDMRPPPGPPEYQQGWKDGCESGWKAYSIIANKVLFEYKQDYLLRKNPVYYQVWQDAYAYCAQYANSTRNMGWGNNDRNGAWILGDW